MDTDGDPSPPDEHIHEAETAVGDVQVPESASTPSHAPSESSAMAVGPVSSTSQMVSPTPIRPSQIQQYLLFADERTRQILDVWTPHELSPLEHHNCRLETHHLLQIVRALEAEQNRIAPLINPTVETKLFAARLEYRLKFGRIFRFNDLPTEIVCNIFQYVVWSPSDPETGCRARIYVTAVCQHWRKVALQDTTIWNMIWFRGLSKVLRSQTWLTRAGHSPKDIRISDGNSGTPMSRQDMKLLLDLILPKLSSIRYLVVSVANWDAALLVLSELRKDKVPPPTILQAFELHRTGSPYVQPGSGYLPDALRQPIPLFEGSIAPALTLLSLNGVHVDWAASSFRNLTVLDLRRIPLDRAPTLIQFRSILSQSPMLRKLLLDGAGPSFVGWGPEGLEPIPLLHLRILILADFSVSYGTYILSQISAPHVRDLTLMNMVGEDYTKFFTALTGAMPEVKILTLYNSEFFPPTPVLDSTIMPQPKLQKAVIKWLESMPLLTYLRIGSLHVTFFNTFLCTPPPSQRSSGKSTSSSRVLCPNLAFLEWQSMQTVQIMEWASRRKSLGAGLKKMYINQGVNINEEQHRILTSTLVPGGRLFLLRPGHKAPEESLLQE